MPLVVRACESLEELHEALVITHYFGSEHTLEDSRRMALVLPVERMHGAWVDGLPVGGAGAYPIEISLPGGRSEPSAGVTVVGVRPTHRRQGVLRALMHAQLEDFRARGEAIAWLWASESTIYGRYGYGLASLSASIDLPRDRAAFADPRRGPERVRPLDADEAIRVLPPLYDRIRRQHSGMVGRSTTWWEVRRLTDHPTRRGAAGPLQRVLVERDGVPVGYALYRIRQSLEHHVSHGAVVVVEAMGVDPMATRAAWRFLLDIDWMARIRASELPVDPALTLLLAEPRRMELRLVDGVWVRLVDVQAALAARAWSDEAPLVIEVQDELLPQNQGRWRLAGDRVTRTDETPDLRMPVQTLGSAYLGGFSFRRLHEAGRLDVLQPGALERADRRFATDRAPWCPEIF